MQKITFLNEKRRTCIRYIFISLFMLYAILSSNSITYGKSIITPVMWSSFALSVIILGYRVLNFREYFKVPETVLLLAVIFSIGLSTLINYKYSFKKNVIFCIYWAIYFLVLFASEKNKSKASCKKDIKFISVIFVAYTTVATLASLVLYFMGVSIVRVAADTEFTYNIGFVWGRLWGVFVNPNSGAILSAVSIIILIYTFAICKKARVRVLTVLDCAVHLLYIVFSDSRSGAVALSVCVAVFALCAILIAIKDKKILLKCASVVLAACIGISCFVGVRYLRTPVNNLIKIVSSQLNNDSDKNEEDEPNIIERGYDLSDDISNRRFDIWKSGLEVYADSPKNMLVGLSFCGFTDYARENMPKTYIVNNDFGDITTLENEIINVLVANGAIGLICIVAFVVYILVCILKKFNSVEAGDNFFVALMLAIVVSLSCAAMFSAMMFYHFSPNAIIFWLMLGNCIAFLKTDMECTAE